MFLDISPSLLENCRLGVKKQMHWGKCFILPACAQPKSASMFLHFKWAPSKVYRPTFPRAIRWDVGVHMRQPRQGGRQAGVTEPHSGDTHVLMTGHSRVGVHPVAEPALVPLTAPSNPSQRSPFSTLTSGSYPISCLINLRRRERWAKNCQ